MANNLVNTLSKYDPQAKDQLQKITRKSEVKKPDFFNVLENLFVAIFLFGFCIVFWVQVFIALGRLR
jgi:hypothetical protein